MLNCIIQAGIDAGLTVIGVLLFIGWCYWIGKLMLYISNKKTKRYNPRHNGRTHY